MNIAIKLSSDADNQVGWKNTQIRMIEIELKILINIVNTKTYSSAGNSLASMPFSLMRLKRKVNVSIEKLSSGTHQHTIRCVGSRDIG